MSPIHHFQSPLFQPAASGAGDLPAELWQVLEPPLELHIEGKPEALELLKKLPDRGLAIVGTRDCQSRALARIRSTMRELRGFDMVVLSGLARGIDTQAHLSALEEGIPTIAVLACGVDLCYPHENGLLKRRIIEAGGLIVSEFPCGLRARRGSFLHRNRLIAGWSKATWVVEAGQRSGALNTARWARSHGRTTFVTPCFPGDPVFAGNQDLLADPDKLSTPLWSARCLAQAWLELESFLPASPAPAQATRKPPLKLVDQARRLAADQGVATLPALLTWSEELGWPAHDFFSQLHDAIRANEIRPRIGSQPGTPTSFDVS